jgi:hypothetical protein
VLHLEVTRYAENDSALMRKVDVPSEDDPGARLLEAHRPARHDGLGPALDDGCVSASEDQLGASLMNLEVPGREGRADHPPLEFDRLAADAANDGIAQRHIVAADDPRYG